MAEATCPFCGRPLEFGVAYLTTADGCQRVRLPVRCSSAECRAARDEAAIARAIAAGVIDP